MPKPINIRTIRDWPERLAAASGDTKAACHTLATERATAAVEAADDLTKTRIYWTMSYDNVGITAALLKMFSDISIRPDIIAQVVYDFINIRCRITEADDIDDYDTIAATIRTRAPDAINTTKAARVEFFEFDVTPFLDRIESKWGNQSKYAASGYSFKQ